MADFGKLNFAVSFNPQTAFPLDARSYFDSLEAAQTAAAGAAEVGSSTSTYYFGQTVVVVEGGIATSYVIQPDHSLTPLAQDKGEAVKVPVNTDLFKYDETGKLTLNTVGAQINGYYLGINADGKLDWVAPINAYTKGETDEKIAQEIAKVDHLSRKIVNSFEDIDADAEDALKYIYMVPNGLQEDDDKYNEYMVIEVEGVRKVEKVGDWAVDLSGYVTTEDFNELKTTVKGKVDALEGSRLMTNSEGTKLATVKENAEPNYVKSVTTELNVDEEGKLGVTAIAQSKVIGLEDALKKKVDSVEGWTLLSPSDQTKLAKLTVGDSGSLEVSGSVNAENVKGLEDWITGKAATVPGLSENNFSNDLKAKLEAALSISSVSTEFEVSPEGQLSVKAIDKAKITGINELLAKTDFETYKVEQTQTVNTLNQKLTAANDQLAALEDRLAWKGIAD